MALKDWKKAGKDIWYNAQNRIYNSYLKIQRNIYSDGKFRNYEVELNDNLSYLKTTVTILANFKSKSEALKFAKEYMKKH